MSGAGAGEDRGFPFCPVNVTNSLVASHPSCSMGEVSTAVTQEAPGSSVCAS